MHLCTSSYLTDFLDEHVEALRTHASVVEGLSLRLNPQALQMKQEALQQHYLATGRTGVLTDRHKRFIDTLSAQEREALVSRITRRSFDLRQHGHDMLGGASILDSFAAEKADNVRSARQEAGSAVPALEDEPTRRTLDSNSRLTAGVAVSPFHISSDSGRPRPVKGTPTASEATTARLRAAGVLQLDRDQARESREGGAVPFGSPPAGGPHRTSRRGLPGGPERRPPPAGMTRAPGMSHEDHIHNMVLSAVPHDVIHVYSPSRFERASAAAAAQRGVHKYGGSAGGSAVNKLSFGSPPPRGGGRSSPSPRRGGGGTPTPSNSQRLAEITQRPIESVGQSHPGLVQNQSLRRASLFNATGDASAWHA